MYPSCVPQISSKDQEIATVKKDAKIRIQELNAAASERDSAVVIETQQEEITKYPCRYNHITNSHNSHGGGSYYRDRGELGVLFKKHHIKTSLTVAF